jgi:high-affinity K+ transport system ATPase subunit B
MFPRIRRLGAVTCGGEVTEHKFAAGHVLAHAGGGGHAIDNYLAAHGVCNGCRWFYSPEEIQWIFKMGVWARNDAPALVEADVGIAMGSGTDVARESADVILIGSDLSKLVETLRVARRCRAIVMQNFAGTLAVDSIGVGLAAFGFLNPLLAAFIHVASELTFILNSTRLLPRRSKVRR